MENAQAAVENGGRREIIVGDWKPLNKNKLRGCFSATLPDGMILHNLMLYESDGQRWIGWPSREWITDNGTKQYTKLIEFTDRRTGDRFRDSLLDALDRYLEANG